MQSISIFDTLFSLLYTLVYVARGKCVGCQVCPISEFSASNVNISELWASVFSAILVEIANVHVDGARKMPHFVGSLLQP